MVVRKKKLGFSKGQLLKVTFQLLSTFRQLLKVTFQLSWTSRQLLKITYQLVSTFRQLLKVTLVGPAKLLSNASRIAF